MHLVMEMYLVVKCKVKLIKGKVDTEKTVHIKDEEWQQGYILACNTKINRRY